MKKRLAPGILTALALVVALVVLGAPVLRAGEYHDGATLYCQECHVMHYSQSHDYSGNPTTNPGGVGDGLDYVPPQAKMTGGPTEKLLRQEANALCLSCHDGQEFAPDVQGAQTEGDIYVRAGGALTETGSDYNGHTMYYPAGQPTPGSSWTPPATEGFRCVDCHDPHGYVPTGTKDVGAPSGPDVTSQYRNLSATAGGSTTLLGVSYAPGTNASAKDIFLREYYTETTPPTGTVADRYEVDVMDLNEPSTTESGMGRWCGGCHGDFHATSADGAGGGWLRHPTATADIGAGDATHSSEDQFGGHLYRVKVMSPGGNWGIQGTALTTPPTDLTPTCLSCHKAHGSEKPFGLIYATGDADPGESGDGDELNDLCRQCHVQ